VAAAFLSDQWMMDANARLPLVVSAPDFGQMLLESPQAEVATGVCLNISFSRSAWNQPANGTQEGPNRI
jgi:hypothetical protein